MEHTLKPKRQAALGFIFATLLIDVIGLAIIIPVVPKLIEHLIQGNISEASNYSGWLTAAYAAMQFLFSPLIGSLSDQYGRRPVLLLSLLGFSVDYLFLAFAPTIGWLFVGRIIAGITGASFTTASAYIADISEPEKRAANFGLIGVAFGLGFIIGPVIGGILGKYNVQYPFLAAAGLALSLFLVYIAAQSVQSVWTFYTIKKFNWDEAMVGYSLGFVGLMVAVVQGGLIRIIIPKIGQERSIWIGLLIYSLGMLLFAFATKGWMMFAFLIPYCLGGIAGPALQGYMSSEVPANEQGELQGGLTSLMSLSSIIGPLIMTKSFYYFTRPGAPFQFPGAPYVIGAVLMLFSSVLAIRSFKKQA